MSAARSSSSFTNGESNKVLVTSRDIDIGAAFTAGKEIHLDTVEALRLRRKLDWHLLPLMCLLCLMTFAAEITLRDSVELAVFEADLLSANENGWIDMLKYLTYAEDISYANNLSANQFKWLETVFFLSYLVFVYLQSLALQRWPVGAWMSINIFLWSVALLFHAACTSFHGLFAARFVLGACEGAIIPGFMIVMAMFYTRAEQVERTGYWFLMSGTAVMFVDAVTFGCSAIETISLEPWQLLFIIIGSLTLLTSILFWFRFPDSPTTARFLTPEEQVNVVFRVQENQAGVENKTFKGDQVIEALMDPKTWLFVFFAACSSIWNLLIDQRRIILGLLGYFPFWQWLFGLVGGAIEMVAIYVAVMFAARCKDAKGWTAMMSYVPSVVGTVLVATLPITNGTGLLASYWISFCGIAPFVIFLSWVGMSTSGHTKRITVNAMVLIASSAGNIAGSFIWKQKYWPRNGVPFSIISACSVASAFTLFFIRQYLVFQNKVKDEQAAAQAGRADKYDKVYITVMEGGRAVEKKVDRAFQDITDLQNREFRYSL